MSQDTSVGVLTNAIDCGSDLCRSPSSVIIGCLSTLFLCAWATAHPSVRRNLQSSAWKTFIWDCENHSIISAICFFFGENRPAMAILGLLAPEYLVFRAVQAWLQSCGSLKAMSSDHRKPLTEMHAQFFFMRGFQFVGMSNHFNLNLSHDDHVQCFPHILNITVEDIRDKSKADSMTKLMTIFQLAWFILQAVSRKTQGLRITNLELTTLASVVCSIILYFFFWNRPMDIQTPLVISPANDLEMEMQPVGAVETLGAISQGPQPLRSTRVRVGALLAGPSPHTPRIYFSLLMAFVISALFLGIHGFAWNTSFPSNTETRLWHFSVVLSALSLLAIALLLFCTSISGTLNRQMVLLLTILVYVVARVCFLVIALTTLRTLPSQPEAYMIPAWLKYLPHV